MADIVSKQTIKPSSPTPKHLRDFKLSFLDQLSPNYYVPVLLFYSASDVISFCNGFSSLSDKLKASLSYMLSLYYPFCGRRIKGNACVECSDEGLLYFEARVPSNLSEILEDPQPHVLKQFLPFDPYGIGVNHDHDSVNMVVQVSEFRCGSVGLGVCVSHKVADGTTLASFISAWAATSKGSGIATKPYMEAALLFPAGDIDFSTTSSSVDDNEIITKRLVFDGTSISRLRDDIKGCNCNPTRVEAVTALIWKSAIEAARASSREHTIGATVVSHVVDIRSLMVPPLPKYSIGNIYQLATSPLVELGMNKRVLELDDLALVIRKAIRKIDANYVSKLEGDGGFDMAHMAMESVGEYLCGLCEGVQGYVFSSWARFPLYETDFGWGKPKWVCTIGRPVRNLVFFMPTRCGEGIEALVNLTKQDMLEFECNPQLLQYASLA